MSPLITAIVAILKDGKKSIPQALRNISLTRRQLKDSSPEERAAISFEIESLELARQFKVWVEKNPQPTLLTDADYLASLSLWFQSAECRQRDKRLLAVACLYAEFTLILADEENPEKLVSLGQSYFYEPLKLAAFILWLLNGVTPQQLIDSQLLHAFIGTHYIDFSRAENPVHQVYALLRSMDNEKAKALVALADATYCGIRGSILNHKASEGMLESSNLSGGTLQHKHLLDGAPVAVTLPVIQYTPSSTNIDGLWRMFGMAFVATLNWSDSGAENFMRRILAKQDGRLLSEIPGYITRGQLSLENSCALLKCIANLTTDYRVRIEQSPFYWHLASFVSHDKLADFPDIKLLENHLQSIPSLNSANEAELLVDLCVSLSQSCTWDMSLQVFNIFMTTDEVSDEASEALERLPNIKRLIVDKLNDFTQELRNSVSDDFSLLSDAWSERLIKVNMLKRLVPEVSSLTKYPLNKHQLMRFMIETRFMAGEAVNLIAMIASMQNANASDAERERDQKRILLETLVYTHEKALQALIIAQLESMDKAWPNTLLGGESLLLKALSQGNEALVVRLLSLEGDNQPNKELVEAVFEAAIRDGQWFVVTYILHLTGAKQPNQKADEGLLLKALSQGNETLVIRLLSLEGDNQPNKKLVNAVFEAAVSNRQWFVVTYILHLTGVKQPNQQSVREALRDATACRQWSVVTHILNLRGANQPTYEAVEEALNAATDANELPIVTLILNLSGANHPGQRAVQSALLGAIHAGQLSIVTHILSLTNANKPVQKTVELALLAAIKTDQLSIVTHILNLTNANRPTPETVRKALELATYTGKLSIVNHVLNLSGAYQSYQERLGYVLGAAIYTDQLSIVTDILNLTNANKPTPETVRTALESATYTGKLSIINHVLNLSGAYQSYQEGVGYVLQAAALSGQLSIVTHILNLTGDNQPTQKAVEYALAAATRAGEWSVVTLLNLARANQPTPEAVEVTVPNNEEICDRTLTTLKNTLMRQSIFGNAGRDSADEGEKQHSVANPSPQTPKP